MKSPDFLKRLKLLQKSLEDQGVDSFVVQSPVDLYYLTGLSLSTGILVFSHGHFCLFVDGRYIQVVQEKSPIPSALSEEKNIRIFLKQHPPEKTAFDAQTTSFQQYEKLQKLFTRVKWIALNGLLRDIRLIKDAYELNAMRKSAKLLWKAFEHLKKKIKTGVSELELVLEFEIFARKEGAEKLAFDPIIAFGANSAMPHYHSQDVELQKGNLVLIDIGVVVDQYRSDMTRTLFFGAADPLLVKWWSIVKDAHDAALKICKPGVKLGDLDAAARKVMSDEGVEEYFIHSLGHGIGLETHEYPRIKFNNDDKDLILKPGMVITIEPGLYFPGKGGIRYEDTIIVEKGGYENLYPKTGQ
jgi:Xaa-Pro aminopeptidase